MLPLPMDINILPPSDDRIFKLILTSPEGKLVLIDLISAIILRPVVDVVVRNNELPLSDIDEKSERLDVNCRIDDGTLVDLEMQASYIKEFSKGHRNLIGKSIYYLCDLHSSQSSKGIRYHELAQTYQVTFCSYTVFPKLPDYFNLFSMRHDKSNELLSNAINVIYVELSKLSEILNKSISDMTDLEKWAVFLRYANIPEHRATVNMVIESKEALQMAGNLLMSVSQSEREQAVFRSRRMYQSDMDSNYATVLAIGRREGRAEGVIDGVAKVARKMIASNMPIEEVTMLTGLSIAQINEL
jgi:predicted transposase/invertase (TIGR01784 family)